MRFARTVVFGTLAAAFFSGCSNKNAGDTGKAAGSSAASVASPPSGDDAWALKYVEGKGGKASGEPVFIGYVNQEGGTPGFPEASIGVKTALEYVNEKLGGVGGRPLQVEKCVVQSEEDGQRCGSQFLNDDKISLILTGVLVMGNKSLYTVINNKKPIVIGNPVTSDDFFIGADKPNAFAFQPGTPAVIRGMGVFALKHLPTPPKTAAIVATSTPASKVSVEKLLKPVLEKGGVKVTAVYVGVTAQTPEFAQALQAAGVDKSDVLFPLTSIAGCVATYDALQSLNLKPTVIATGVCVATAMTKHLHGLGVSGDFPDGWYFGSYGYSYFIPDKEGIMSTYLREIKRAGPNVEFTGFAGPMFMNTLTVSKLFNHVGVDKLSPDAISKAARDFKGPAPAVAGPISCGDNPSGSSLCSRMMGIQQYKDGTWVSIADAYNGKPIDPSAEL